MRDQCKGDAAYVDFLRGTHVTAKDKEVDVGSSCPFFQTKGGCPFAKDTSGKPVLSPDYIVVCYIQIFQECALKKEKKLLNFILHVNFILMFRANNQVYVYNIRVFLIVETLLPKTKLLRKVFSNFSM